MFEKYPALEKYLVINKGGGYISSDQNFRFFKSVENNIFGRFGLRPKRF